MPGPFDRELTDSFNTEGGGLGFSQPWMSPKSRPNADAGQLPAPYSILMASQKRLFGDTFTGGGWPPVGGGAPNGGQVVAGQGSSTQFNLFPETSGQHRGFGGHVW